MRHFTQQLFYEDLQQIKSVTMQKKRFYEYLVCGSLNMNGLTKIYSATF